MSKITQERLLSSYSAEPERYTVVTDPSKMDVVSPLLNFLYYPEHTFVLGITAPTNIELLAQYSLLLERLDEMMSRFPNWKDNVPRDTSRTTARLQKNCRHELSHYDAVLDLTRTQANGVASIYDGQLAAVLAVAVQLDAKEKAVSMQPACLIEIGEELSLDDRLFALATIISAPFTIEYNPADLSKGDLDQLRSIRDQLNDQTPRTNNLRFHLDELLDPVLFDFNTRMLNNE